MDRICPFRDCGTAVNPDLFCCPPHWAGMPDCERLKVSIAYRKFRNGTIDLAEREKIEAEVMKYADPLPPPEE